GTPNAIANMPIPKMALIRIIDPTVEPGYTYQYRVRIRMLNPNYQKRNVATKSMSKIPELSAKEWTTLDPVEIPPDAYWCVTEDRRDPEKATVQIQRWLDYVAPDPKNPGFKGSVAEWTILEKTPAYRGEYIGGIHRVKVPVWKMEQAKYELAKKPGNSQPGVPVDLSVRGARGQDPALLIDIEGGKGAKLRHGSRTIVEDMPLQLLVLAPDGRLIVRSTEEDGGDQEFQKRYRDWKQWITELEKGKPKPESMFDRNKGG